jgi:hypothetical protein
MTQQISLPSRRKLLALCAALLAGCSGSAGPRPLPVQPPLSAEDEASSASSGDSKAGN